MRCQSAIQKLFFVFSLLLSTFSPAWSQGNLGPFVSVADRAQDNSIKVSFETEVRRIESSTLLSAEEKDELYFRARVRRMNEREALIIVADQYPGIDARAKLRELKKWRFGFFTGLFNPVHLGHESLMVSTVEQLVLDDMVVIPTVRTTHNETPINWEHRAHMLHLGLSTKGPEFIVADQSYKLPLEESTGKALDKLFQEFSHREMVVFHAMGTDSWERFVSQDYIKSSAAKGHRVMVVSRFGYPEPMIPAQYRKIVYSYKPKSEENVPEHRRRSSTNVRNRLAAGLPVSEIISPAVEAFIFENGIYDAKRSAVAKPPQSVAEKCADPLQPDALDQAS